MFCSECGAQNPDTNQFCKNCGKPLLKRQPAVQPVAQPAVQPAVQTAAPVPAPFAAAAPAPVPAAAPKRKRNWFGFLSLILGFLSWGILTVILSVVTVVLGMVSLFLFRRATGRIGISSIIGIVLGIAALAVKITLA